MWRPLFLRRPHTWTISLADTPRQHSPRRGLTGLIFIPACGERCLSCPLDWLTVVSVNNAPLLVELTLRAAVALPRPRPLAHAAQSPSRPVAQSPSRHVLRARWVAVQRTEAWAKSSRRQENSAIILVLGGFRSIYLDGSLNFRASPRQISPKI
jgi:hypothetical protein